MGPRPEALELARAYLREHPELANFGEADLAYALMDAAERWIADTRKRIGLPEHDDA